MQIDCKALCKYEQDRINDVINNKKGRDELQNATIDYETCITACNLRKHHSRGGGNRKKYIGKTKNWRSRTRRRDVSSRTQRRKKTQRRQRR